LLKKAKKRYRNAFADFDYEIVQNFLTAMWRNYIQDKSIIRNSLENEGAPSITAKRFNEVKKNGSFSNTSGFVAEANQNFT